jgi:flagellar M-ring protein FliF
MDQLRQLLSSFTRKQKVTIVIVAALVISGLVSLSRWNHERDFKPLYSGLAQEDAAAVLVKVRESGTEFRLDESGSTVLVPGAKVAELRLQLAAAGVPRSGRIGFELFDKTNFGASDFAEQINYHRALEGELERSVMALAEVEAARVHVTFAKDSIFLETRQPAKASVLVKLRPGARLSPQNVAAITQLTASAIEGLQADAVSVVDMRGNLLSRPHRTVAAGDAEAPGGATEYRQQVERDLVAKINTTLEPLLGADKFRAGVSVDCDFTSGEQSEETFDPAKSVMVTSQRTEDIAGTNTAAGIPGTASNLPRPAARPSAGSGGITRRTENVAYQSSRTVRHMKLPQGTIKRMSVSVLVDHAVRWEGSGAKAKRMVEAPSPEKLKSIRDLVSGVIGLSTERGDQLIVEALPFEATLVPEQMGPGPANPAPAPEQIPVWLRTLMSNRMVMIGAGVGVVVLLGVVVVILKMFTGKNRKRAEIQEQLGAASPARDLLASSTNATQVMEAQIAEQAALKRQQEIEAMTALKLPQIKTKKSEVLTKHIGEEAKKDASTMVQVLRNWINEVDTTR